MNGALIFRGPHLSAENDCAKWSRQATGLKALGLTKLPLSWSPPFLVITTSAFQQWKESGISGIRSGLSLGLAPITGNSQRRLIIRSSAATENLDCRGWLESAVCSSAFDDAIKVIDRVWNRARNTPNITEEGLGLIAQEFISPKLHGHLSNERRVSKNRDVWLCEAETPAIGTETKAFRFRAKTLGRRGDSLPLFCASEDQLFDSLKSVASWSLARNRLGYRSHFEWVWDGRRLWIVQWDIEEETSGDRPSCSPIPSPLLQIQPPNLVVFVKGTENLAWKKTKSAAMFARLGMKVAQLYVLEGRKILSALATGHLSSALKKDLCSLLECPIVFRTDFATDGKMPKLLSTRSHTLSSFNEAATWLIEKARKIVADGFETDKFCFIAHRFIPARSGAICLARPDRSQVRIDAIWGFPDGLLCFPHDTFYLPANGIGKIDRRLRCKPFCLSEDNQGTWIPKRCPAPWDWRSSLEDSEIREIAIKSHSIAQFLKHPVEVMFFVGVNEQTGYPAILPWIHLEEVWTEEEKAERFYYAGKSFTVTNAADLERLEPFILEARKSDKVAIRLKPAASLLRDKDFVMAVASAAKQMNVPVQLEGSILSHTYYMLNKEGVKARCMDAAVAPRYRQKFGKLVRDLIDVKIRARGEVARVIQVPKDELLRLLKSKALEEAFELFNAERPEAVFEELADILEVILALCKSQGRTFEELNEHATNKRKDRGSFERGIVLMETEAVPLFGGKSSEPTLFGVDEPATKTRPSRNKKTKEMGISLSKGGQPRIRGKEIVIPLIPPHSTDSGNEHVMSHPDGETEAVIRFAGKNVLVEIRKKQASLPQNQLWLELG